MINELDKAEIRHEARDIYRDMGMKGALEVLDEVITFATILAEVLKEEMHDNLRD